MTISVSATPATTYPASAAPPAAAPEKVSDGKQLNQNFDQFLLLLTAQLKNQDPLSPMDSTQFTNQLVSFSGVEQQIKMNSRLEKLLALSAASQTTLGLSYIGLNVDMQGSDFKYYGAGDAKMSYNLPSDAAINTVSIIDQDGHTVYSQSGVLAGGAHEFIWNGKDQEGNPLPSGTYHFRVDALDTQQKNMTVTTVVPGLVEGIQTADDGSIMLIVNDQEIPMSDIRKATL
jgi:flagellar basal-body rod modification protein FlgD